MGGGRVVLSKRLQMLGNMVTAGSRAVDVGCDHGFLSIWLVQAGVSGRVLAMDVRRGPLEAARKHIEAYGLGDYIETRLSDGLQNYEAGEADTLICAGMGGRLMRRILTGSMEKVRSLRELILQPQSELWEFRVFLRREGFEVMQENAVSEEGKYYFSMKVCPRAAEEVSSKMEEQEPQAADAEETVSRERRVCDRFGEKLILQKNPALLQYLLLRREKLAGLAETLSDGSTERQRAGRRDILLELSDVEYALGYME